MAQASARANIILPIFSRGIPKSVGAINATCDTSIARNLSFVQTPFAHAAQ